MDAAPGAGAGKRTRVIGKRSEARARCVETDITGAKHDGQWKAGKRHGQGTQVYTNGGKYEGGWKMGLRHGQGTMRTTVSPEGDEYIMTFVGGWRENMMHGNGTMTYPNGNKYEGEWKDGKMHGQGEMVFSSGHNFGGEWNENMVHGQGIMEHSNGVRYEGEFNKGMPQQVQLKKNKKGECKSGNCMNGKDTWVSNTGEKYEGRWTDGRANGHGTMAFSNGHVSQRSVEDGHMGKKHEQGTEGSSGGDNYDLRG